MTTPKDESNVDNLIDFSPTEEKQPETVNEFENLQEKHQDLSEDNIAEYNATTPSIAEGKHYSRLCGYLNKLGNQKILKTFRKRWFVFNEGNCKLYYYRSPNDLTPLGEIDISQATFSFEVNNKERSGLFTISVPGRDYFLEANNRQTCLFWLQELQKYRRVNSLLRTKTITDESSSINDLTGRPQSGLLAQMIPNVNTETYERKDKPLMQPVDCPTDVIGDDSAANSVNPLTNAHQKLNVFYNQLKTSASFTKYDKPSLHSSPNTPSSENTSQENLHAPLKPTRSGSGSHLKTKYQNLSSLKLKFSHSFRKGHSGEEKNIDELEPTLGKESCSQCSLLEKKVDNLTDENSNLQDEVTTSREVLSLLQRQLDIASKEKDTLIHIYQLNDSEQHLKLLSEKDQKLVNVTHDLQENQQEVEKLQRHIISLKAEVTDLQKNNELFQEMLIQKDKTIMALTNEVFDLETERQDERRKSSVASVKSDSFDIISEQKDTLSMDELKDAVQAFELQNKFLNNEILELNKLRRDSEERVRLLSVKCSEWEARSYQIQSKLLFLLNELQHNGGSNFNEDIVNQLLQEAIGDGTSHTNFIPTWSRERRYDDLGFNWRWGKEDLLSLKACNLKQKSEDMANKVNDSELVQWRTKWDTFMVALGNKELQRSQELKALVRMGIPREYRGRIWKECSLMWIKHHKASFGSNYYNSLLSSAVYNTKLDPYAKQIELDLLRTLPNNLHYETLDSDGVPKLRRVLLAFSRHNPDIGYCQGLNRLAAIALLFMEEEDAFWCLIAITKKVMPENYYSQTLIGSHVDQKVLKDLMADKLPRLHSHLEQNNVDLSLFTFNWFFTVFVDNIPVDTYLQIWDVFLYEGSKVLFRYALAILKLFETEILQMKDYLSINKCLRNIAEHIIDAKKLTHIAFNELNPFSIKTIASKRVQHYPVIETQIQELVSMRNSLSRNQEKVTAADYMSEED